MVSSSSVELLLRELHAQVIGLRDDLGSMRSELDSLHLDVRYGRAELDETLTIARTLASRFLAGGDE